MKEVKKMGFLDSFINALSDKEVIAMYNEDDDSNYRKRGLENASSNYGWYTCIKCGKKYRKGDMDIDHIIPKSKGGGNTRDNLQCICKHCNRSKQADTSETAQDLKRRSKELKKQDKDDLEYLAKMRKQMEKK